MTGKVRLGIIGIGNMGLGHIRNAAEGLQPETEITAIADIDESKFINALKLVPDAVCFNSAEELINSGLADAVVIATPHYSHPVIAKQALASGLHVMSEKPAGVFTKDVRELIEFSKTTDKTYAIMYNQRTNCVYRKIKELVSSGRYGDIKRVSWIITDWFRTQAYYNSGGWRATWAGEGGGVMLNQCPHQLDLWQWICGMPSKIRAFCHEGKWHDIEVEDDVSIYAEYPNGATGTFITSTGDCPGTNRLEITMDRAKIVVSGTDKTELYVLHEGTKDYIYSAQDGFDKADGHYEDVVTDGRNNGHPEVMNAFAAHILRGEPLIADGAEGINGLTISNAVYLSSWLDKTVELPIDEDLYYKMLQEKIKTSKAKTNVTERIKEDMGSTF